MGTDGVCGIGVEGAPLWEDGLDGDELGLDGELDGVEGGDDDEDDDDEELLGEGVGMGGVGIEVLLLVCWEAQPPKTTAIASVSTGQTLRTL